MHRMKGMKEGVPRWISAANAVRAMVEFESGWWGMIASLGAKVQGLTRMETFRVMVNLLCQSYMYMYNTGNN